MSQSDSQTLSQIAWFEGQGAAPAPPRTAGARRRSGVRVLFRPAQGEPAPDPGVVSVKRLLEHGRRKSAAAASRAAARFPDLENLLFHNRDRQPLSQGDWRIESGPESMQAVRSDMYNQVFLHAEEM